MAKETDTYNKISKALSKKFINEQEIAEVIALAIESKRNAIIWGPAGHGKSEMVEAALLAVAEPSEIFIKSFGDGETEDTLFGGLDFLSLEIEKTLRFDTDRSFLNKKYAILEEFLDAPAQVLCAMKDCLTSKQLRKGSQLYPMKTETVIVITNHDPGQIKELGPSVQALIERFPLQYRVVWPNYTQAAYKNMFTKLKLSFNQTLLEMCARLKISPRSAVYAAETLQAYAKMHGHPLGSDEALLGLRYVEGFEKLLADLPEQIQRAKMVRLSREFLDEEIFCLNSLFEEIETLEDLSQIKNQSLHIKHHIHNLNTQGIVDELMPERDNCLKQCKEMQTALQLKSARLLGIS